jgi:hypothetical protein
MTRRGLAILLVVVLVPVAVHAVWDQMEATSLARAVAALADRHEAVSADSERSALATQEQRRAARLYAAAGSLAAQLRQDDPRLSTLETDVERAFLEADPAAALAPRWSYYVEHEPALALLDEATPLDFAGFGPAAPQLIDNASPLLALASINTMRTAMLIARHDSAAAAQTLIASVGLQRTIVVEFYRRQTALDLFGSLRLLLVHAPPDADTLAALQQAFEALPDEDSMAAQLRYRRASLLGTFWPYLPHNDAWALRVRSPRLRGTMEELTFVALRPLFTRALRQDVASFDAGIEVAARPWPEKIDAMRELADRLNVHPERSLRMQVRCCGVSFTPMFWGVLDLKGSLPLAGENLAIRRVAVATLAVERYRRAHGGSAPPVLDALVPAYLAAVPADPFTGTPLLYRTEPGAYVIYSTGRNRTDEGGLLYGFGAGKVGLVNVTQQAKQDVGIRVPKA